MVLVVSVLLAWSCQHRQSPLPPLEALKTFHLPDGFRIELVAAEPEVLDPVAMAFDEQGRLFVVEMGDYPTEKQPVSRIKLLEDSDGDGRYERSWVFADSLHFAHGIMPWKRGVLVTSPPDLLYFEDTDGDHRADVRKVVLSGFAQVNPQLRLNAPTYGIDNWIYAAYPKFGKGVRFQQFGDLGSPIHFPDDPEIPAVDAFGKGMDLRFKPDELKLEAVSGNSEFGLAFNARGHRFTSWNDKHIQHVVIEDQYLKRNPQFSLASAVQSVSDHGDAAEVYPASVNPYLKEIRDLRLMSQLGHFTSACGQAIYTGGRFPGKYEGAYFVCEPVSNLVHCDLLYAQGATYTARRALEKEEFLTSTDSWFMPVFTANGPDGGLYVVDFYRKSVEHPEFVRKEYMDDEKLFRAGSDRGRIYRIVFEEHPARPRIAESSTADLVKELSNRNGWWRLTAQRLLVERQDPAAVPALKVLLSQAPLPEGRMHALWTLEGMSALTSDLVLAVLDDPSGAVREQAVQLAEKSLSDRQLTRKLLQMTHDPDGRVAFQLACTLGGLPPTQSFKALEEIAARHLDDNWFLTAILTSVSQRPMQWFRSVLRGPQFAEANSGKREEFLRRISTIIGARSKAPEIEDVLAIAERLSEERWQVPSLEALAEGLKQAAETPIRLEPRAQSFLLKLMNSESDRLGLAAFQVSSGVQITDTPNLRRVIRGSAAVAADPQASLPARVRSIRILGLDSEGYTQPLLAELLSPQQPEEVQMAAVRALASLPGDRPVAILLQRWKIYTAQTREIALQAIVKRPSRVNTLMDAIEKEAVPVGTLSRSQRNQLVQSPEEKVRQRARSLFASLSTDRSAILEKYRSAVEMSGNPHRGEQVYKKHCSRCHQIGSVLVGPDLLTITRWTKEDLLGSILDPNANIVAGYEEYLVETRDGSLVTGVMIKESATAVTLRRTQGEEDTILRSNIVKLRALTVSAMPEGTEQEINVEQMGDLLAFLLTLRAPKNY